MKKPVQPSRWAVYMPKRKPAPPIHCAGCRESDRRAVKEYDVPEHDRFRVNVQREA